MQLCRCKLGRTIDGYIEPIETPDENIERLVAEQYRIENFGNSQQTRTLSKDDQRALENMDKTVKKIGYR